MYKLWVNQIGRNLRNFWVEFFQVPVRLHLTCLVQQLRMCQQNVAKQLCCGTASEIEVTITSKWETH